MTRKDHMGISITGRNKWSFNGSQLTLPDRTVQLNMFFIKHWLFTKLTYTFQPSVYMVRKYHSSYHPGEWFVMRDKCGFWCRTSVVFDAGQVWFLMRDKCGFWCRTSVVLMQDKSGLWCRKSVVFDVGQVWFLM